MCSAQRGQDCLAEAEEAADQTDAGFGPYRSSSETGQLLELTRLGLGVVAPSHAFRGRVSRGVIFETGLWLRLSLHSRSYIASGCRDRLSKKLDQT